MNLWSTEQILVSVSGPDGRREFVVPRPFARIGSHSDSEIVLTGGGVAPRALYLHATADGLFCLDLDVEDTVLETRGRWLDRQDTARVGPYLLNARLASGRTLDDPLPPSPVIWGSSGVPLPVLNVHCQRLLKDKRRFRARLNIVGRRPQCALQLRGSLVSSFHCALFWENRRLWCIDLLSSNGTQLNGAKIDFCEVQLNDRLDIGEFGLVYYRWSPRLSMQPDWQPAADIHSAEQDPARADDSAPALDAALPSPAAATDLALAADLADSDGSDIALEDSEQDRTELFALVRPGGAAALESHESSVEREFNQWRRQLREEQSRLVGQRQQFQAEQIEARQRLQTLENELHAESSRLAQLQEATEAARQAWQAERRSLTAQLEAQTQQLGQLNAEVAAAAKDADFDLLAERQAAIESLTQKLIAAEQDLAARQQEIEGLRVASAVAAPAGAAPQAEQLLQQQAAEVARLKQEREEVQAQWRQSTQRFSDQIAQLHAEAGRFAQDRMAAQAALDESRRHREQLEAQLQQSTEELAALRADLAAAQAALAQRQTELAQRQAEHESRFHHQEARLARLNQERQDLQTQWAAASAQLAAQAKRSQEQAARLAELRTSFDAARKEWQAERRSLTEQLAGRAQRLSNFEAELAAATADLNQRRTEVAERDAEIEMLEEERAASQTRWGAATSAADRKVDDVAQRPEPPMGRPNKGQRHEITTFVGDRLIEIDHDHRRRSLMVWGSVAAGTVVLSALILGVLYLFQ
jgi:hypothetical protein